MLMNSVTWIVKGFYYVILEDQVQQKSSEKGDSVNIVKKDDSFEWQQFGNNRQLNP